MGAAEGRAEGALEGPGDGERDGTDDGAACDRHLQSDAETLARVLFWLQVEGGAPNGRVHIPSFKAEISVRERERGYAGFETVGSRVGIG